MGKVVYHTISVKFQIRGYPHILSLLWIPNTPKLRDNNIDVYINFVDSIIKTYVPDLNEDPKHFNVVITYQVHSHSKSCRKYKNQSFGKHFTNILLFHYFN